MVLSATLLFNSACSIRRAVEKPPSLLDKTGISDGDLPEETEDFALSALTFSDVTRGLAAAKEGVQYEEIED